MTNTKDNSPSINFVVVLNWKAADETIECLDSIFLSNSSLIPIVLDNASQDSSLDNIRSWLSGRHKNHVTLNESELLSHTFSDDLECVLVQNKKNHGYAGGNNPGIAYAANQKKCKSIWLLNNDARIDANTFPELISHLEKDKSIGFVGSIIRYYESPEKIQCAGGGVIYKYLGKRKLYYKNHDISEIYKIDKSRIDYLMGASLLINPNVIQDIGLMSEEYFMYSEELDWQLRAKYSGWNLALAENSHIFHKGAQSTAGRSHMYHYYLNRSSVIFTKRFYSSIVLLSAICSLAAFNIIKNIKSPKNLLYGFKGIFDGVKFNWAANLNSEPGKK